MRTLKRILTSWWSASVLLTGLASTYVFFSFGENPYQRWIHFVFHSSPGLVMYGLLILNLTAGSISRLAGRFRKVQVSEDAIKGMDSFLELPTEGHTREDIGQWVRSKGHSPRPSGEGFISRKGTVSVLAGTVLRLGLILFLASFALSTHFRITEELKIPEGGEGTILGGDIQLMSITPSLPDEYFQVGDSSSLNIESITATAVLDGERITLSSGYPKHYQGIYLDINHLGYFQQVSYKGNAFGIPLDILPPGRTHTEMLDDSLTAVSFTLAPGRTVTKGILKGMTYDLASPSYLVKIRTDQEDSQPLLIQPGQSVQNQKGAFTLGKNTFYIGILAAKDPALPGIWAGAVLMMAGGVLMFLRIFWYEKRFMYLFTDDRVLIGYEEEHFRKWGNFRFQNWADELLDVQAPPGDDDNEGDPGDAS